MQSVVVATPSRRGMLVQIAPLLALLLACGPVGAAGGRNLKLEVPEASVTGGLRESVDFDLYFSNETDDEIELDLFAIGSWIEIDSSREVTLDPDETTRVHLHLECGDGPMVRHSWLIAEASDDSDFVVPVRLVCGAEDAEEEPDPDLLYWEPPLLQDATLIRVPRRPASSAIRLEEDRDYLVLFPDEPVRRGLAIVGGRNVVVIGGEIEIPEQDNPTIARRRALLARDATGTVHIEGMWLHGEDITEGIQLSSPDAVVQLQNLSVLGLRAHDQEKFSDNHPDVVQPYGNVAELRIDRLTASTDYQGLFLSASTSNRPHGPVTVRRTNIRGDPTARYLFWVKPDDDAGDVVLEDVWLDVPDERSGGIGRAVWPDVQANRARRPTVETDEDGVVRVSWPESMRPNIVGDIASGTPPGGDFVPPGVAGTGYESPGYRLR